MSQPLERQVFDSGVNDLKGLVNSKVDSQTQQVNSYLQTLTGRVDNLERRLQTIEQLVNQVNSKLDQVHNRVMHEAPNERRRIAEKFDKFNNHS